MVLFLLNNILLTVLKYSFSLHFMNMKYFEFIETGTSDPSLPLGISNDGNTCFLASATQILITIPSIKRLVLAQFILCEKKKVALKNLYNIFRKI